MEEQKLLQFLDTLEAFSSGPARADPASAQNFLLAIHDKVLALKLELLQQRISSTPQIQDRAQRGTHNEPHSESPSESPSESSRTALSDSQFGTHRRPRSGAGTSSQHSTLISKATSTINIDESLSLNSHFNVKHEPKTSMGLIDAIRLAALSVERNEKHHPDPLATKHTVHSHPNLFDSALHSPTSGIFSQTSPVTRPLHIASEANRNSENNKTFSVTVKESAAGSTAGSGVTLHDAVGSSSDSRNASGNTSISGSLNGGVSLNDSLGGSSGVGSAKVSGFDSNINTLNGSSGDIYNIGECDAGAVMVSKMSRRLKCFNKCFPVYRQLFRYETQPKHFLKTKNSDFASALSPNCQYMALVNNEGYQVFSTVSDYNIKPKQHFTGSLPNTRDRHKYFVSVNNSWLVIARTDGYVVVISLDTGKCLFKRNMQLAITALKVSSEGSFIFLAVFKSFSPNSHQALIYLICPSNMLSAEESFEHPDIVSFESPYNDSIQTMALNEGETALVCTTEKESRIFIASLANYREPRILIRSKRTPADVMPHESAINETKKRPQGITGAEFLPNSRFVLLSSSAPSSPPVILDTKLNVTKGKSRNKIVQYLSPSGQQQAVVVRFDKMGSSIQACIPSPKGNGVAFVDNSGAVYAANLPSISTESRKIAVLFNLAAGSTISTTPALQFTPDGTSLFAVDRKGDLHIADFGADYPQQPGIMKSRLLS